MERPSAHWPELEESSRWAWCGWWSGNGGGREEDESGVVWLNAGGTESEGVWAWAWQATAAVGWPSIGMVGRRQLVAQGFCRRSASERWTVWSSKFFFVECQHV